jgi:hypothetical protein
MKILIFSHPRSGSGLLQRTLSKINNLHDYDELFSDNCDINTSLEKIYTTDNFVARMFGHDFNALRVKESDINLNYFDKIYITGRKNLTDSFCSEYTMTVSNDSSDDVNYIAPPVKIYFIQWCKAMKKYNEYTRKIYDTHPNVTDVYYEDLIRDYEKFISNLTQDVDILKFLNGYFKKSNLTYENNFKNYKEIDKWVQHFIQSSKGKL